MDPANSGAQGGADKRILGDLLVPSVFRPWWSTFWEEFGEAFDPPKFPPLPKYRDPLPGEDTLGGMTLERLRTPWYLDLVEQVKYYSDFRKLAPLQLTSKPIAIKSIWGAYDNRKEGGLSSITAHVVIVGLMLAFSGGSAPTASKTGSVTLIVPVDISPYLAQLQVKPKAAPGKSGGGGGGGQNSPLPASKGKLPRFALRQFVPPTPIIRNKNPKLAMEPTVLVPPDVNVARLDMNVFGDPLAKVGPPSAGPGTGGGIGTGRGTGVGSGRGGGVGPGSGGGIGGGVFRVGGGVSAPRLTYKVEPEYSEEARKNKYQGTVVLAVEVWPDGRAHNLRVVRSLGLGLDEKAIEAVSKWKFVPGKKDGKSVRVAATIEVNFRLL